jgi:hypothetical protein
MRRNRVKIVGHLSSDELLERYRQLGSSHFHGRQKESRRWQALWLISKGHSALSAAEITGLYHSEVYSVLHRYNEEGPRGVSSRSRTKWEITQLAAK